MKKTILIIGITLLAHSLRLFGQSTYQQSIQKGPASNQTVAFSASNTKRIYENDESESSHTSFSVLQESGKNYLDVLKCTITQIDGQ